MVQNLGGGQEIKLPLCYFPLIEATNSSVNDKLIYSLTEKETSLSCREAFDSGSVSLTELEGDYQYSRDMGS